MKLDTDEKEILRSFDNEEWRSLETTKRERTRFRNYAEATFRKDRRVNIRLSGKDLQAIQKRALAEGLPYQTLISSLLHKYAAGRLTEDSIIADATLARSPEAARSRTVEDQLRSAIVHRRLIKVTYHGKTRVAEPHVYGLRKGTATLMIYQVKTKGAGRGKSSRGWSLLDVSKIEALTILDETFSGDRSESSSQFLLVNELFTPSQDENTSPRRLP
jgi:predicted DNA binding CopG/RHH family protein